MGRAGSQSGARSGRSKILPRVTKPLQTFPGVLDLQKITITLTGVTSSDSQVLPATPVSMNVLLGDSTADKTVNSADGRLTKSQVGIPVTPSNFRSDVAANGTINNADVRLVKSAFGHTLP